MNTGSGTNASSIWDLGASGWQYNEALVRGWLADATEQMLDAGRIGAGMSVLDIAAGTGGQTLDIARRVGRHGKVLATDISPQMIELTQQLMRSEGIHQVQCTVADAQSIELAIRNMDAANTSGPGQVGFDAATCRLGLMFCNEPLLALRGIRNCLAPGGRFSALVFSNPLVNPCIRVMISTAHRHLGLSPSDPFSPGTMLSLGKPGLIADLLLRAGFADIEVRPIQVPFRLARCEDYVEFVRTSGAPFIDLLRSMDKHDRERVWDDITRQLRQFTNERGWEGPNELLLCSARSG